MSPHPLRTILSDPPTESLDGRRPNKNQIELKFKTLKMIRRERKAEIL